MAEGTRHQGVAESIHASDPAHLSLLYERFSVQINPDNIVLNEVTIPGAGRMGSPREPIVLKKGGTTLAIMDGRSNVNVVYDYGSIQNLFTQAASGNEASGK